MTCPPTDEELLLGAVNGDDRAISMLLARYRTFVRRKAHTYFVPGGDRDDVIQEGMIGLYKAVCSFDPEKGARFRSFANVCVTHQIHNAISMARRKGNRPLNLSVPLSPPGDDEQAQDIENPSTLDPMDSVISAESRDDLTRFVQRALTPLERQVLIRYLDGQSYDVIAAALDRRPKAVDNALQRIRRKVASVYLASER